MNVTIDCSQIKTREDLHRIFSDTLSFPVWYGKNLDALHDCLMDIQGELRLLDWEIAEANLGKYGMAAKKVIAAAAFENRELEIIF